MKFLRWLWLAILLAGTGVYAQGPLLRTTPFSRGLLTNSSAEYSRAALGEYGNNLFLKASFQEADSTNKLYLLYSRDLVHWSPVSTNGTASWTNPVANKTIRDPSLFWHENNKKLYCAYTYSYYPPGYYDTTNFGLIWSSNCFDWYQNGNGHVPVCTTNAKIWAPDWFQDGDNIWITYLRDAVNLYRIRATDSTLTNWTTPELLLGAAEVDTYPFKFGNIYGLMGMQYMQSNSTFSATGWTTANEYDTDGSGEGEGILQVGNVFFIYKDLDPNFSGTWIANPFLISFSQAVYTTSVFSQSFGYKHGHILHATGTLRSLLEQRIVTPVMYDQNSKITILKGQGWPYDTNYANGSIYCNTAGELFKLTATVWVKQ